LVLEFQNADGGWATYERNRGYNWFEWLNPAEVFGDIMIDYTYTELTSACVTALTQFQAAHPSHRSEEVSTAIQEGVGFVRAQQRTDGSFYGSWAICFTYGTWFGVEALVAAGTTEIDTPALKKAGEFLVLHQNTDGGWGESYLSCVRKQYVSAPSTAFNTAWALLALIKSQSSHSTAVEKGVRFLLELQDPSGDWPQQSVAGVFNRTCGITYTAYRNVFPIWALGAYRTEYKHRLDTAQHHAAQIEY
jgi:squalene/oxidosqualene cyclase-like protein